VRLLVPLLVLVALGVAVVISNLAGGQRPATRTQPMTRPLVAGSPAAFTYLAAQRSNRCSVQAREILTLPDRQHLRGSCCTAMDPTSYRRQVQALARFRAEPQIPRDPYDIRVRLAKRLLRYQTRIGLTTAQQRTHAQAMRRSPERGPCCCHCWRWETMAGLSKYLIAVRHWRAPALATLIGDLDGCGGAADRTRA
jgi:hypothetical protein